MTSCHGYLSCTVPSKKLIYLVLNNDTLKLSMSFQNWLLMMIRFIIEFGDHLSDHL
ncbi:MULTISPECIES: hypothetical protein [unclassified Escherichia]|uniref:hypothetical protein n=1 Tax=unclassified Escherichia TaxID=2608889 RepID=UPI0013EE4AB6|nr:MULTISPECIES: hypothetical protein [unclassified Escherichia]